MCIDPTGHALLSIIGGIFIGSLITQLLTSILGAQIAGGLGSVGLGASSIAVGTSMFAFGPMGILTGSIMIAAGIFSILGGTSEIGEGLTGYNFMIDGMGMNRGVYDVAYAVSGMISTIGSIGAYVTRGKISDRMLDSILTDPNKINNYSIKRFKAVAKYSSWKTGPLTQSSQGKVGFKALHPKDGIIQWHSTPRHNSGSPYWKVAEGKIGTWKFDYLTGRRIF